VSSGRGRFPPATHQVKAVVTDAADPALGERVGHPEQPNDAAVDFDDEADVVVQRHRVDTEEVGRQDALGLGGEELSDEALRPASRAMSVRSDQVKRARPTWRRRTASWLRNTRVSTSSPIVSLLASLGAPKSRWTSERKRPAQISAYTYGDGRATSC
jgi:hypothetical protein